MKKLVILAFALAGCSTTVSTGSEGVTSDGGFVAGDLQVDTATRTGTASIISPEGWSCTAQLHKGEGKVRTFPATCDNGDSGTFVLSGNADAQTIGLSFKLQSGRSGQVIFTG